MTQNQIALRNVKETERHNLVYEGEVQRHNIAQENETGRHNLVSEDLERQARALQAEANTINREHYERADANAALANAIQSRFVDVQERHFDRSDSEMVRHNLASEMLSAQINSETQRHDRASEALTSQANVISQMRQSEDARHNIAQESITSSHNTAMEDIGRFTGVTSYAQTSSNVAKAGADIGYTEAKTVTEGTQPALNRAETFESYTQGARNIVSSVTDIIKTVGNVMAEKGRAILGTGKPGSALNGSSYYDRFGNWIGE